MTYSYPLLLRTIKTVTNSIVWIPLPFVLLSHGIIVAYTPLDHCYSLFLSLSVSLFEGKNFLVLSFSWIAQPFGFRPSHSGWKRQRYKMCAKLFPHSYTASGGTVLPMGCYASPPLYGDANWQIHTIYFYTGSSYLIWLVCFYLQKVLFQHSIVSCREAASSHPKQMTMGLGCGQSTLWLWTKGWIYPQKVQTSHKSMPSKSMPSAWMILSSGQQTAMKSNFKISGRWIFIKGAADWTSSWISPTVLNGYIKTHWFRR